MFRMLNWKENPNGVGSGRVCFMFRLQLNVTLQPPTRMVRVWWMLVTERSDQGLPTTTTTL